MDRNKKVEWTMEGYQEVLDAITIADTADSKGAKPGNISSFLTEGARDEKEAILKEVVANLIM